MKAARQGGESSPPRFRVEDLADPRVATDALIRWDELDPSQLRLLEGDPRHGPRLARLREAETWLRTSSSGEHREPGPCPTPGELYDHGRGPGYRQIDPRRRAEIDRHLARCRYCDLLVETLAAPPPVPFDVVTPAEPAVVPMASPRLRSIRRFAPLAAAAGLVAVAGLWFALHDAGGRLDRFPESPLLRGGSGGPVLFPRDRILHPDGAAKAAWPVLGRAPVFEIEPLSAAESYRVEISRHDGSAFATVEPVGAFSGSGPVLAGAPDLSPGHYTWEAWALVRGLDQRLGARDFEIAADADTSARLAGISGKAEPARSLEAIHLLHDRGYKTDARAIARSMPPSPERDAYLGQVPGR